METSSRAPCEGTPVSRNGRDSSIPSWMQRSLRHRFR
nr:MAG TPA_asm: hypothetical protein [Caudoviricetes sp.]